MKVVSHLLTRSRKVLSTHRNTLVAILVFFVYATLLTWPFLIHPLSTQTSAIYGDNFSSITKFDAIKFEGKNPFIDGHLSTIAYPDGLKTNVGVDRVSFFSTIFLYYGTLAVNSVFAHGLFSFLGLFLSGVGMYLFVRKYVRGERYAYLAGLLLCTFPLMISLQRAAPIYMHMWLYLLPIWAFAVTAQAEQITKRQVLLLIASIIPGIFWTPYFTLHILIIFLTGTLFLTIKLLRKTGTIPVILPGLLLAATAVICALYYWIGHSSAYASVPARALSDAYTQSLHPLLLVLPNADTWWSLTIYKSIIQPMQPRIGDFTLYLGISVVFFAFLGIWGGVVRKVSGVNATVVRFVVILLLVSLAFSLAPTIHFLGIKIPTPNYFVVHTVPALRAGQRLVGMIMLCLLVLAAVGVKWVMEHHYTTTHIRHVLRPLLFGLIVTVLISDIMPTPWEKPLTVLYQPSSMITLTNRQAIVAEYMNDSLIGYPGQMACKNYLTHHQVLVNSCGLDIDTKPGAWPLIESIARSPLEKQFIQLKKLGVSFVILDKTSPDTLEYMRDHHITPVTEDGKFFIYNL